MHENTTYTFHGDAPIGGLLPAELDLLVLGHMVRQEQQQSDSGTGGLSKRKRDLEQGRAQAREEMLQDVGFQ